jgi:methionine--tRNA ligase beta chain
MVNIEDFQKLEIRIGRVKSVEKVEGADRLLKFIFDIGGEDRQIISGIAESYPDPSMLVGREVPIIVNLEPRTIKGFESNGMVLAADSDGMPVLLHPERDVPTGSLVK